MPEVRLIDANALKKAFCDWCDSSDSANSDIVCGKSCATLDLFDSMPTIEAEPVRRGRWIPTEYDAYADGAPVWDKWECSECGHEHSGEEDTLTAFCPDCGARMDGGADNG